MRVAPRETDPIEDTEVSPVPVLLGLAAVVVVGFLLNAPLTVMIVAIVVMMLLHELGHFLTAKWGGMKVTQFFLGFGPRLWSFKRGETEYGVRAIPAGAFVTVIGMSNLEEVDPADEDRTYRSKSYGRRLAVAVAGSTMHFLIAFALILVVIAGFGLQREDSWHVATVTDQSAALAAGIEPGDRVLAVDGREFGDFVEMSEYIRSHPDQRVELTIQRDGERLVLDTTLGERAVDGERVGFLGISPAYPYVRSNLLSAIPEGIDQSWRVAKGSVSGLAHIFSPDGVKGYVDTIAHPVDDDGNTKITEDRPTSVVGIAKIGSDIAENGYANVLFLLFGVNIFIGIFNLLPVLPFDGGHVAIATYEKVRSMISGRRYQADVAKLLPVTYLVVLALALLFVTSLYLDIAHPIDVR